MGGQPESEIKVRMHVYKQSTVHRGGIGDEGLGSLDTLGLDVDALRLAAIHRLNDVRGGGEGDRAEGGESLE